MAIKDYDRSLNRLIMILHKLWKDERPTIDELAEEFQVSKRTIQRDVHQRLSVFYIDKDSSTGRLKFMDGHKLESSLIDDEMLALVLSVPLITDSTPQMESIASNILYKLVHPSLRNPYYIKPNGFQQIDMDDPKMNLIEDAINDQKKLSIQLESGHEHRVEPYKIIAFDGIWYLLARDEYDEKIKTYFVHKIINVTLDTGFFSLDEPFINMIKKVQTPWFEEAHKYDVKIEVSSKIAHYFELKRHLPSQKIEEKRSDGSIIISFSVSHDEEVDNLIKSWMPDIRVLSPKNMQKRIRQELRDYLALLEDC